MGPNDKKLGNVKMFEYKVREIKEIAGTKMRIGRHGTNPSYTNRRGQFISPNHAIMSLVNGGNRPCY